MSKMLYFVFGGLLMLSGTVAILAAMSSVAVTGAWRPLIGLLSPSIQLTPPTIAVGKLTPGMPRALTARLTNSTATPIRIVGGKNSCGCLVTDGLPLTIPAGETASVPLTIEPRGEGFSQVQFQLFTDRAEQPTLGGFVTYTAVPVAVSADDEEIPSDEPGLMSDDADSARQHSPDSETSDAAGDDSPAVGTNVSSQEMDR